MSNPASRSVRTALANVVRRGVTLEHAEQSGLEALRSDRDARHAVRPEQRRNVRRHRLRIGLDRDLGGRGQRREKPLELPRLGEGRRPAAEEHRLELLREHRTLQLELGEHGIDVGRVLSASPDDRDEVAVPAAMRAERQVHVEVTNVAHR